MEKVFLSYSRSNTDFVLRLVRKLKEEGVDVWLDQTDIHPGSRWDVAIEKALESCDTILVVFSPDSVSSQNVLDEVSYGIEEGKRILPVLLQSCKIPFRLRRFQYTDFTVDFDKGFPRLMKNFEVVKPKVQNQTIQKSESPKVVVPPLPKDKKVAPVPEKTFEPNEIMRSIESMLQEGGNGNFMIIEVDRTKNYYLQLAAGKGDKEIYTEIVGNSLLETPYKLSPETVSLINDLGWQMDGEVNYSQTFNTASKDQVLGAVNSITSALTKVFGVKSEKNLNIELVLE